MPTVTRIQSFERDIDLIVRNDLSPQAQSVAIANYADAEIRKSDEVNRTILGRYPPKTVTVDGRSGAALEAVNPNGGTIIAEWELIGDVLQWIGQTLEERSPRVSGRYARGHTLFADGVLTDIGSNIPAADEYLFVNSEPYARKIEVGMTRSGRSFVIQVPNRIYERTAADARRRFGNLAKITFTFQSLNGGAVGAWASTAGAARLASRVRGGNPKTHHDWLTRQPAIQVTLNSK